MGSRPEVNLAIIVRQESTPGTYSADFHDAGYGEAATEKDQVVEEANGSPHVPVGQRVPVFAGRYFFFPLGEG